MVVERADTQPCETLPPSGYAVHSRAKEFSCISNGNRCLQRNGFAQVKHAENEREFKRRERKLSIFGGVKDEGLTRICSSMASDNVHSVGHGRLSSASTTSSVSPRTPFRTGAFKTTCCKVARALVGLRWAETVFANIANKP